MFAIQSSWTREIGPRNKKLGYDFKKEKKERKKKKRVNGGRKKEKEINIYIYIYGRSKLKSSSKFRRSTWEGGVGSVG